MGGFFLFSFRPVPGQSYVTCRCASDERIPEEAACSAWA